MFNDISISKLGLQQKQNATSSVQAKTEDTSIFGNNLIEDKKTLTKEEIKAEKKAKKEAEKAERERIKNTPDGIIQGGRQGSNAGDCWLLAQMNSMSKTPWGKKAFKDAITKEQDGSFTVHFKGIDKDVKISQKEFEKAQKNSYYSSGDADPLLLELAVEKHFKETNLNEGTISGNSLAGKDSLQYLMTGNLGRETTNRDVAEMILKSMGQDKENNNGISATYVYYDKEQGSGGTSHAISVQSVNLNDKGEIKDVVLLDSYKPDRPYKKDYRTFMDEMQLFGFTRITQQDGEKVAEAK